jgi:hypothetical protein
MTTNVAMSSSHSPGRKHQRMEAEKEGRGDEPRSSLPDSAPSVRAKRTDDSRRVLASSPNRAGARLPRRFRRNLRRKQALAAFRPLSLGPPKRLGNAGPATDGLRTSIKNTSKLAARRKGCQAKAHHEGIGAPEKIGVKLAATHLRREPWLFRRGSRLQKIIERAL